MSFTSSFRISTLLTAIALAGAMGSAAVSAEAAEVRFRAELVAPAAAGDVSGKAEFRNRMDRARRQFSVEVEGLEPGTYYDVVVAGEIVGKIRIDAFGMGDLNYDDNFEPGVDDPATRFPSNFPGLDGGERVEVGDLSGTLN